MKNPFEQNTIAMVWDFDKTLICNYMQEPLFRRYDIDASIFWNEVNRLQNYYAKRNIAINRDTCYLNHLLTYVKSGKLKGLSNRTLHECGKELIFFPGLPDFFPEIKNKIKDNAAFKKYSISVEHYVVSTGFAETIKGSAIAPFVDGIFGCEFIETPARPGYLDNDPIESEGEISQVAVALDNTSKTRYLFEINKGSNKHPQEIDVNSFISKENRRIPFENMIYIADGPSDVPAFSILNNYGGSTFAIYPKGDKKAFQQVEQLRKADRVETFGEADYTNSSHSWMWLCERVESIANRLAQQKEENIRKSSSAPPGHL